MQIPKSTSSKRYPNFIRQNEVVHSFEKQEKVFPKIGLPNCSASFSVSKYENAILLHLEQLCDKLVNERTLQVDNSNYPDIIDYQAGQKQEFRDIIGKITTRLQKEPKSFILKKKNKVSIILPFELKAYGITYVKGADFFNVLFNIRLNSTLNIPGMNSIFDEHNSIKEFSSKKNLKVVFSGNGGKGLWDLATMSMRGLKSCQRWGNTHARCLVGSLIDPYAGIVYITNNNKTARGPKMLRRAVVRFVVHKKTGDPAIMLERIYPHDYNGGLHDYITFNIFANFIASKTKSKFKILYGEDKESITNYFIPKSHPVDKLIEYTSNHGLSSALSYRDSKIEYYDSEKYKDVSKLYK